MENKIREHINSLGCEDYTKASLAYQLYIELCEVKTMHDVKFEYNKHLDIVYLTATPTKKSERLVYVPYSTSRPLSMKTVSELQDTLCTGEVSNKCLTLACIEGDTTTVLYSFTPGLLNVDNPDCLVRHKKREERGNYLENEIKKHRFEILLKAHENGVTELKD